MNKASALADLLAFADELKECENTLEAIGYLDEINSSDNLRQVIKHLPYHLKAKWLEKASDLLEAGKRLRLNHILESWQGQGALITHILRNPYRRK